LVRDAPPRPPSASFRRPSALLALRGLALLTAASAAPVALAGGGAENAILIVDPSNAESMLVANHYRAARGIPDANVLYLGADARRRTRSSSPRRSEAFLGSLENLRIADHVDFVVLPSGGSFYVDAPGLVADDCSAVTRFSSIAPYVLARESDQILAGTDSILGNGYYGLSNTARAFARHGLDVGLAESGRAAVLRRRDARVHGRAREHRPEVLAMIDRSVAADATFPSGTIYYMHTNDPARSGPRDAAFPAAVSAITGLGGSAQLLFANLPIGNHDCHRGHDGDRGPGHRRRGFHRAAGSVLRPPDELRRDARQPVADEDDALDREGRERHDGDGRGAVQLLREVRARRGSTSSTSRARRSGEAWFESHGSRRSRRSSSAIR
jgi:hypothetical protein